MRKIYLIGEINEESFKELCEKMDELESAQLSGEAGSRKDIEIVLNSIGGNALDAIAFLGRIRQSPCEVNVTVYGIAGSAAVLVLAACDYRRMSKESWTMVHEDSHTSKNVKTITLEQEALIARQMETQWNKLLEECTGTKEDIWKALHSAGDTYLTPEECLKLGLIQEIV